MRRGSVASEHLLQLFDTDESLATSVSGFIADGLTRKDRLVVVATAPHWGAIRDGLRERMIDADLAITLGQLTVLGAAEMLARFMRRGEPNPGLFRQTVGALVAELAAEPGLRIYGEMVEVLACEGNYTSAAQLEELWNQLLLEHSFTLLCGYSAAHFAAPDAGSALATICRQHTHTISERRDSLANFLLGRHPASSSPAPATQ